MGVKFNISDLVALAVNFPKCAAAIAYIDSLTGRIVTQIIRVIAIVQSLQRRIRTRIEYSNTTIFTVGNV